MELFVRIIVIGMFFIGLYFAADQFENFQEKRIQAGGALIKR